MIKFILSIVVAVLLIGCSNPVSTDHKIKEDTIKVEKKEIYYSRHDLTFCDYDSGYYSKKYHEDGFHYSLWYNSYNLPDLNYNDTMCFIKPFTGHYKYDYYGNFPKSSGFYGYPENFEPFKSDSIIIPVKGCIYKRSYYLEYKVNSIKLKKSHKTINGELKSCILIKYVLGEKKVIYPDSYSGLEGDIIEFKEGIIWNRNL
jgi:hypothetical protein